jgi:fumarate reductase (CoM/CoB) subunit B
MRVTDVLNYIYQNRDQSLAFRYSCRAGLCGVCLLKVNGKACLSCHRIAEKEMTIEPPSQYSVIKDLVVDFPKKGKRGQTEEE